MRSAVPVLVAVAFAALGVLGVPAAARAQTGATLDGTPLNVFADGLGGVQVRQDGVGSGLFYNPDEDPGHAGLEIKEGDSYYPLQSGFDESPERNSVEAPAVSDAGG